MPHEGLTTPMHKEGSKKLKAVNIRILDDGTYVVRFESEDYTKSKEYSYEDIDEMFEGIRKDLKPLRTKKE